MKLFVDTSAWLAMNDNSDQHHAETMAKAALIKKKRIDLITSDYVIDESLTIIRMRLSHKAAVLFGESVLKSGIVTITDVKAEDRLAAWELFRKFADKEFSFTDCTSFVLMKKMKLHKCFTFDNHFSQMGFEHF
jgi:uncharacterized protein